MQTFILFKKIFRPTGSGDKEDPKFFRHLELQLAYVACPPAPRTPPSCPPWQASYALPLGGAKHGGLGSRGKEELRHRSLLRVL